MTAIPPNFFPSFEYRKISATPERTAFLLDCYESLGWEVDPRAVSREGTLLRRERRILNKMELTRLQNHLESCIREIDLLEASKTTKATISSLTVGMIGTVLMAGSFFAAAGKPPMLWLCVLLAIPAMILWGLAPLLYKKQVARRTAAVNAMIEKKYDEICEICEKGSKLL